MELACKASPRSDPNTSTIALFSIPKGSWIKGKDAMHEKLKQLIKTEKPLHSEHSKEPRANENCIKGKIHDAIQRCGSKILAQEIKRLKRRNESIDQSHLLEAIQANLWTDLSSALEWNLNKWTQSDRGFEGLSLYGYACTKQESTYLKPFKNITLESSEIEFTSGIFEFNEPLDCLNKIAQLNADSITLNYSNSVDRQHTTNITSTSEASILDRAFVKMHQYSIDGVCDCDARDEIEVEIKELADCLGWSGEQSFKVESVEKFFIST